MSVAQFLARPGRPGPFGALLDETARAASQYCSAVEGLTVEQFLEERPSEDSDTVSIRSISAHVCRAARGYANDIRQARGLERALTEPPDPRTPAEVRPLLVRELRFTEETLEPILGISGAENRALEFRVSWGVLYDPEMILEHGVCHLLRHRRQLDRWDR